MQCLYCGAPLPQTGRRGRRFCNAAHKQASYRSRARQKQAAESGTGARVVELEQQLEVANHQIAELEDDNARLKSLLAIEQNRIDGLEKEVRSMSSLLDIEKRFYSNQPRNFRGWLRKQWPSDLVKRLLSLADPSLDRLPRSANRASYLTLVRLLHGPESDVAEFEDLWRSMLLSEP